MKAKTLQNEQSSDIWFGRQAIVHMNNAGVSLLHCGDLHQAIETFTDALTIANLACRTKPIKLDLLASQTGFTQLGSVDIRQILEKAYDRLCHPKPSMLSNFDLKVISDNENLVSIHSRYLAQGETKLSMDKRGGNVAIHTDHLDVELLGKEEEMAIQSSIVCYNYGIAYLGLSTLPASHPFVDKLYTGALKMFQLAFSTLTSHHWKIEKLQSQQMNRVLITGLFVLHNLLLLSTTLGMAEERNKYLHRLIVHRQVIHEFCRNHHAVHSPTYCAA